VIDLVKVQQGARWWFWLTLIVIIAICFHPLWSAALAAIFTPAAVKRLKTAVAEKEKQAAEFQRIAETEPNNVIISIEESVEDAASTQKTVEEAIEAHQDDPSPFMED
tara:strand:+ start:733 stop:1056 length:324 start_codon:yes stop_codon:yes gene_type:complete